MSVFLCRAFSGLVTINLCILLNLIITKTCPCNEYPLKPHLYIVKPRYAGVYLFFLFLVQNIDCRYSLAPPHQGGSNVPTIYVLSNTINQRTNGPVNAHLSSAAYTNKHVRILWYLTPVQKQMKPLGHFLFSE